MGRRGPPSIGGKDMKVLACDFFLTVTATFRMVYVFLVLDVGTRRIIRSE
jgi:hypothetical protein